MSPKVLLTLLAGVAFSLLAAAALPPAGPPPPITYLDESGTRFLTLEWRDASKVKVSIRTVAAPGLYGHWEGQGEQTDKGIVFTQTMEDPSDKSNTYLAAGGQSRLVVKLKPGQAGTPDLGVVGTYQHISNDKIASLLKKDAELAEKKVDEALKLAAHQLPAPDRPALPEWKKRWTDLRTRLTATAGLPPVIYSAGAAPGTPPPAPPTNIPRDQTALSMALAETSGTAASFLSQPLPPGLKPGWEGIYEDGFGGSADLQLLKSGRIKFTLTASRISGSVNGTLEESLPPEGVKDSPNGNEGTADFTDHNEEVKDPAQQTRIHFHRIGHFLIIDTQEATRYSNRAWFEGIYLKRPTPPAE